jgi:molybdenum cofactor cytidylyltransferase
MISGIVLAGGESKRMNTPKALLTMKAETFAESIVNKMKRSGVGPVRVVAGLHYNEIKSMLEERLQADIVWNENHGGGQISSLKVGLKSIPLGTIGVLVWPVDLPLVMEQTAFRLIRAFLNDGKALTIPAHNSRHGHPVMYGKSAMEALLSLPEGQSARDIFPKFQKDTLVVEVNDPGILIDIDSPEDYANYVLR